MAAPGAKYGIVLLVYNTDGRAVFLKFLGNAFADALYAAGDDGYFMLKHTAFPRISVVLGLLFKGYRLQSQGMLQIGAYLPKVPRTL